MNKVEINWQNHTAIVQKPAVEKYARKLVQDELKKDGIYGVWVSRMYEHVHGHDSEYADRWEFRLFDPYSRWVNHD